MIVESGFKNAKKRLCGENLNEEDRVYISRLNTMVIHFQSDHEHEAKGFRAVYETGNYSIQYLVMFQFKKHWT